MESPYVHPLTGITHVAVPTGWDPPILAVPNKAVTRFQCPRIPIPDEYLKDKTKLEDFNCAMRSTADALSLITGFQIEWHYQVDSCCCVWGEYGWFKARDVKKEESLKDATI